MWVLKNCRYPSVWTEIFTVNSSRAKSEGFRWDFAAPLVIVRILTDHSSTSVAFYQHRQDLKDANSSVAKDKRPDSSMKGCTAAVSAYDDGAVGEACRAGWTQQPCPHHLVLLGLCSWSWSSSFQRLSGAATSSSLRFFCSPPWPALIFSPLQLLMFHKSELLCPWRPPPGWGESCCHWWPRVWCFLHYPYRS